MNNFGILPWEIWLNLWKFWPVILILIGIEFFLGQAISLKTFLVVLALIFLIPFLLALNPITKNPLATDKINFSQDLGSLTKAKIIIDMPAANLNIKAASPDSAKLIEGTISFSKAANKPVVSQETVFGQAIVTISQSLPSGIPFLSSLKNKADIFLTNQIPLEIQIKTAASTETLDLTTLRINYLEINSQASSLKVIFDGSNSSQARIKTSASNVELQIPKELEAKIRIDSKVKTVSIDSRFKEKDGQYQTEGFDKAFTRLDIEINSLAGSVKIY